MRRVQFRVRRSGLCGLILNVTLCGKLSANPRSDNFLPFESHAPQRGNFEDGSRLEYEIDSRV